MTTFRLIAVGLIMLAPFGCTPTTARTENDPFERVAACAMQADRFGDRLRAQSEDPGGVQVGEWTSHWNTRDGKCYVQVSLYNSRYNVNTARMIPLISSELYDAFEGVRVAVHTSSPLDDFAREAWCRVADNERDTNPTDCAAARLFMLDKLSN